MNNLKKIIDQEYTEILPANYSLKSAQNLMLTLRHKKEAKMQRIENIKLALFAIISIVFVYLVDVEKWSFSIHISKNFINKFVINGLGIGLLIAFAISEIKLNNKKASY